MEIVGVIHGHSTYSDGHGTAAQVAAAAASAGLDFLVMTDHDTLQPLAEVGEAFHGRTLLLWGCEVSPPTNHLLAVGASTCPSCQQPPQAYLDELRAQGALTFLAHPHDRGVRLARVPSYRWDSWPIEGYTGIEVWNQLSDWGGRLTGLGSTLRALQRPAQALRGPEPETLQLWDQAGLQRRVVGIGGLDVHDIHVGHPPLGVRIFPYAYAFRTIRCHVRVEAWPEAPKDAKAELLQALQEGRLHFADDELADSRGIAWSALDGNGAVRGGMGDELACRSVQALRLSAPRPALLTLVKDGVPIMRGEGRELSAPTQGPGVYRAELRIPGRGRDLPWAYTNPIYLRG